MELVLLMFISILCFMSLSLLEISKFQKKQINIFKRISEINNNQGQIIWMHYFSTTCQLVLENKTSNYKNKELILKPFNVLPTELSVKNTNEVIYTLKNIHFLGYDVEDAIDVFTEYVNKQNP